MQQQIVVNMHTLHKLFNYGMHYVNRPIMEAK